MGLITTKIFVKNFQIGTLRTRRGAKIQIKVNNACDFLDFVNEYVTDTPENIEKVKQRLRGFLLLNKPSVPYQGFDNRFKNRNLKNIVTQKKGQEVKIGNGTVSL